jgi:hypothetical protein
VRTQAYLAMLAGAAGHGYGALDLFYFYKEADGPFPKNGFQDWRTAMGYEGSRQVGLMRRLFEKRPWFKMLPDQSLLASEPGGGPFRMGAARGEDRPSQLPIRQSASRCELTSTHSGARKSRLSGTILALDRGPTLASIPGQPLRSLRLRPTAREMTWSWCSTPCHETRLLRKPS